MTFLLSTTALLWSFFGHIDQSFDPAKVIAYAKRLDVSQLDPSLPKRPLQQWVKAVGAPAKSTEWRMSDCDLKPDPPEPPEGRPLCVEFVVGITNNSGIWGHIVVGTDRKGITGQPRFMGMTLSIKRGEEFESSEKLSDLPRLTSRAK